MAQEQSESNGGQVDNALLSSNKSNSDRHSGLQKKWITKEKPYNIGKSE